jgi:prepilin peptidase CpaA
MDVMSWIPTVAFVAVMLLAMFMDVRTHRIPNKLTLVGLVLGLLIQVFAGPSAILSGLAGAGVALGFGLLLFALGGMGGGDAKLFAVVGAFMGLKGFFLAMLATAIVGGLLALIIALKRGVFWAVLLGMKDAALRLVTLGRRGEKVTIDSPGAVTIPYGAAIALGSIAAWFTLQTGGSVL